MGVGRGDGAVPDEIVHKPSTERRRSTRYPVSASVLVTWRDPNGQRAAAQGVTRDICLKGMFVATDTCPPISSIVRCEVLLPPLQGSEAPGTRFVLQTVGRVVRTETNQVWGCGIRTRVAVLADSVSLPKRG